MAGRGHSPGLSLCFAPQSLLPLSPNLSPLPVSGGAAFIEPGVATAPIKMWMFSVRGGFALSLLTDRFGGGWGVERGVCRWCVPRGDKEGPTDVTMAIRKAPRLCEWTEHGLMLKTQAPKDREEEKKLHDSIFSTSRRKQC